MTFLAVGWLALLVPWAAIVAWAWRRVAEVRGTTAAFLWSEQTSDVPRASSRRGRPPVWMLAALLATLAAILSLAGPAWRARSAKVIILVDRFVSLSAKAGDRRSDEVLAERCDRAIAAAGVIATREVRVVGNGERVDSLAEATKTSFTARSTDTAMRAAIDEALRSADPVIVLTDRLVGVHDDVAVIAPEAPADNVGIEYAVAVDRPRPSVMVRIANDSVRTHATLEVRSEPAEEMSGKSRGVPAPNSATGTTRLSSMLREIALPPRGERANVFVELASPGRAIEVSLVDLHDALPIDDTATLLRTGAAPQLILDEGLPPIAGRFAAAYVGVRAPTSSGVTVHVRATQSAPAQAEIVLSPAGAAASGAFRSAEHPIFRDLDMKSLKIDHIAATPPAGWAPIGFVGDAPIIAVRDAPARGVWIGFDLDARDARAVVLLANAVDWITDASAGEWSAQTPDAIGADWRPLAQIDPQLIASPGRYQDGKGREVAVNLHAVIRLRADSTGDIGAMLRRADRDAFVPFARPLAMLAGLLAGAAAVLCGRRRAA